MSKSNKKFNPYWIYGTIVIVILGLQFFGNYSNIKKIDEYQFFDTIIKTNDVENVVVVNNEFAEITIKKDSLFKPYYKDVRKTPIGEKTNFGPHYEFNIVNVENFKQKFDLEREKYNLNVTLNTRKDSGFFDGFFGFIWPILLIVILISFFSRRLGGTGLGGGNSTGGLFNVGKSKAKLFDESNDINVTFNDVAGLEGAKDEVEEIVNFLKTPEKYTSLGGKIPKGALLVGPPGTGKTLLAKAVAGEAKVPFFSISGSDFMEMFVGVGASRVRDLFKQAKEKSPCIVFIDEIDAIGRSRSKNLVMSSNDERENTLNQLLSEMDGFDTNKNVIILGATNRVDILDKALLRPGRFDRQIHIELPNLKEREEIFNVHVKPLKINKTVNIEFLSKQTPGFSGADIANICNESALIAARKDKKSISRQDFMDAIDRVIGGLEKRGKLITTKEKKIIAYHEAGHATVSWMLKYAHPLVKVTIVPRGNSLGSAWYLPNERHITTKNQILDEMCSTLGGRASEEIIFGEVSTGALNDLERVTKQSQAIVTIYGLNDKIGNITYFDSSGQSDYSPKKPYSEKTSEIIDSEISSLVEEQYIRAKELLKKYKSKLQTLAELLLEREVVLTEDLEEILGPRPFSEETLENTIIPKEETISGKLKEISNEKSSSEEEIKTKKTKKKSIKETK